MNCLALGRLGNDFEEREETLKNGETKTRLVKVGTKFKAGGGESFACEPHLLLELSLERNRNRPRYGRLTALLAKAIKEQQAEIRELKLQIEKMARLNDAPATGGTGTN